MHRYDPVNMLLRRCDRYVLREMAGPFLVSVFALLLFIVLNLILSLSDLMVDRGVGIPALLRLLVLKLPGLLVLALPASALFATFLGLGRLVHDREVIAFEAAGISLRRLLLPLLVAALALGGVDFALYNWASPASEHAYQRELRSILFRQGSPHVRANTFLRGPEGQFFYVRRYDEKDGTLRGVLVYDTEGKLLPNEQAAVTILTAEEGRWEDVAWSLVDGRVYAYDRAGVLVYAGRFEALSVPVGRAGEELLFGSRTPSEMGIAELRERIALLRSSGLEADELVVEVHLRGSIPLATVVFVLFGGAASLIFAWRSRAAGIVVSLLLVGLFQGTLLWTQTLGRRGLLLPSLAAWVPDLLFGAVGIWLFLRLGRFRTRRPLPSLRRILPLVVVLLAVGLGVHAEEAPIEMDAQELSLSADRRHVRAEGEVRVAYGETTLRADLVTLDDEGEAGWVLRASGEVELAVGDGFSLSGGGLVARLALEEEELVAREATALSFRGRSRFVNSAGEEHLLIYAGEEGRLRFDAAGEVSYIEASEAEVTTCDCCGGLVGAQPYSIRTGRLLLYPDRLIVAFNLTLRSFGRTIAWLPAYVQPLKEALESPLFPAIGESDLRGLFLKWSLPFFLDERNYGAVLLDYFSRFAEVGLGAILRYAGEIGRGNLRVYAFPAKAGDSVYEVSLDHSLALAKGWSASGKASYRDIGGKTALAYTASLSGTRDAWRVSTTAERTRREEKDLVRTIERVPEISLTRPGIDLGPLSLAPSLSLGRLREWEDGVLKGDSLRFDGGLALNVDPVLLGGLTLSPGAGVRLTHYGTEEGSTEREALSFSLSFGRPGLSLSYAWQRVNGVSPFSFDTLSSTSHLAFRLSGDAGVSLRLDGGYDLVSRSFDPLVLSMGADGPPSWTIAARYDLLAASLVEVAWSGRFREEKTDLSWRIPYRPALGEFDPATLSVRRAADVGTVEVDAEVDLNVGRLSEGTLEADLRLGEAWGVTLGGRYRDGRGIVATSLGFFRDLYDCLRLGVERRSGDVWVYVSILAFPEAILRYAPTGGGFQVGA
jgi:LPS export ABC transporter permease LptG